MSLTRRPDQIFFHRPWIGPEERAEVLACLDSGWLTTGPRTKEFEKRFAETIGVKHAIGLNSCTAGLHLALVGLNIGPGDDVITTPLTFVATANVIVHVGARPVFVDVDPRTGNIDPDRVKAAVTPRTKAILAVHYAGHPCEMDAICDLADRTGVAVIEDAAHAVESEYRGRRCGTFGKLAAFSFYATKNMTTGEGGMLVTNDDDLADRLRVLSLHGMNNDAWKRYDSSGTPGYELNEPGFKYNMFDLQASLGLHQLSRLETFWRRRRDIVLRMRKDLSGVPAIRMFEDVGDVRNGYHLMPIVLTPAAKKTRGEVIKAYGDWNIGIGIHFECVHLQPFYRKTYGGAPGMCPVAENIGAHTISIPLYPRMSDEDVQYVIDVTQNILRP